jgi:hypothetical protein
MQRKATHILVFFLLLFSISDAQEMLSEETFNETVNIDSLIADSIRKEFIQSHIPLSAQERSSVLLDSTDFQYGPYLKSYMKGARWFGVFKNSERIYLSKRENVNREWVLYLFLFLLFILGFIHSFDRTYFKNLFRVYLNQGFVFRQTKDQLLHSSLTSLFLNLLSAFSGSVFLFFGLGLSEKLVGVERFTMMGLCSLLVIIIYTVKFTFFKVMGWLFDEKETFEDYLFIVFSTIKLAGLLMLIASMLMAITAPENINLLFTLVGYILLAMLLFRSFKGYLLFAKEVSFPIYLLASFALDILPLALLIKFVFSNYSLFLGGLV